MAQPPDMHRLCLGILILIVVDLIWVCSSEVTEYLFKNEHYSKPFFSTYVKTVMFSIYLFGFLFWNPWRQQCRGSATPRTYVDPNVEEGLYQYSEENYLSDATFVPIRFHDGGEKSSGTESDDSSSTLSNGNRSVHFSKVSEVRQLSESQAEDAVLARLSYTASTRAQEEYLRLANKLSVKEVVKLALQFSFIWFAGNLSYQVALVDTQVGIVNVLSSNSASFTLILASIFPANNGDRFTLSKLIMALMNVGGIVVISLSDLKFEAVPTGVIWALAGSFFYACYIVLLRRKVDSEDRMDVPMFFGFVGLFTLLLQWPGLVFCHYMNLERFVWPSRRQWLFLALNGLIGTVVSELLWLLGCFLTSSLIGTLALSLTIPLTMVADIAVKKITYSNVFFVGMVLVFVAFFATTLLAYYDNWDPVLIGIQRFLHFTCPRRKTVRVRDVDKEQTESLIGINSNEDHDA